MSDEEKITLLREALVLAISTIKSAMNNYNQITPHLFTGYEISKEVKPFLVVLNLTKQENQS